MKRIASVLFAAVLFTFIFSSCSTKANVSQDDLENSLLLEWCGRFRGENVTNLSVSAEGAELGFVGEKMKSAAAELEPLIRALTEEQRAEFSLKEADTTYLRIADNKAEYFIYLTADENTICVVGPSDSVFFSAPELAEWIRLTVGVSEEAPTSAASSSANRIPDNIKSILEYGGYQWFVADGYFSRYVDGKGVEQLYKLPFSDDGKTPVVAAVSVIAARIALSYHVGGATMGQDVLRLFDGTTGTQTHEVVGYGSVAFYGDIIVKTTGFMPPAPDNLRISRDGGKNWENLGDPKYLYGVSVTVSGNTVSYRDDNGGLSLAGDWLYISGIDTSTWDRSSGAAPEELSLRVNLETGETVVRNE